MVALNLDDLIARLRYEYGADNPYAGVDVGKVMSDAADALESATAKLREAEGAIAEALNHDPLHGRKEGMHCGGMAPCIRETLTAHEPWNYEK